MHIRKITAVTGPGRAVDLEEVLDIISYILTIISQIAALFSDLTDKQGSR